jgi:hypothetical protein
VQLVILEAVTAGAAAGPPLSPDEPPSVSSSLQTEALTMVAALAADCLAELQQRRFAADRPHSPVAILLPATSDRTAGLGDCPSREDAAPDEIIVFVPPSQEQAVQAAIQHAWPVPASSASWSGHVWRMHIGTGERLETRIAHSHGPQAWYLPTCGKGVRSQLCEAPVGPFRQLTPDPFTTPRSQWCAAPAGLRFATLGAATESGDGPAEVIGAAEATWLIAPQPSLGRWMRWLGPAADRVLGVPADLLPTCEDKRHLTAVPSLCLTYPPSQTQPDISLVGLGLDSHGGDVAAWYRQHLATTRHWAVKPTDQCGSSDVWRIDLWQPLADLDAALAEIQRLRSALPRDTSSRQTLLWSPWLPGPSGSVSVLATEDAWWCLPPCRQILDWDRLAVPVGSRANVRRVQAVRYSGSTWESPKTWPWIHDLVWRQFAARFPVDSRHRLRGWIGLDYVLPEPNRPALLEVNPRLTSSYHLTRHLRW